MQSENDACLCRLDSLSLDGVFNVLPLKDVRALTRTGDKRLCALLAASLRQVHLVGKHDLLSDMLHSEPAMFRHVVLIKIEPSFMHNSKSGRSMDAFLLPPCLTKLKAPHCALQADIDPLVDDVTRKPILPHLKVLQVLSFKQPLSCLSTALQRVDVRSGFVDFEIDKPAQFNIRSLRVDCARLKEAGALQAMLDRVSPSKMTIEKFHDYTYCIDDEYFPPSVTHLRWSSDKLSEPDLLRLLPKLPKGLTRLVVHYPGINNHGDRVIFIGVLELMRRHLPNLTRLTRNNEEEVLLENGQYCSFFDKLGVYQSSVKQKEELSSFMIFDQVRQPTRFFAKYMSFSPDLPLIMVAHPTVGYHMVRHLSINDMSKLLSSALLSSERDDIEIWICQLDPIDFDNENQLIVRWVMLLKNLVSRSFAIRARRILEQLEPKLAPNLFRVMLHLIWIIAYLPPSDEINPFKDTRDEQRDLTLQMLRDTYNYKGFISKPNTTSYVVWSLRRTLVQSFHMLDTDDVAFARELMEDGAFADAACRGLVDSRWFDRYGTWRTMHIIRESVGKDLFSLHGNHDAMCREYDARIATNHIRPLRACVIEPHAICNQWNKSMGMPAIYNREDAFEAVRTLCASEAHMICCPYDNLPITYYHRSQIHEHNHSRNDGVLM